jgi:putative transposase
LGAIREERPVAAAGERRALRDVAVRRLAALAAEGPVSRDQVAQGAGVSDRTVWRWLAQVEQSAAPSRASYVLDAAVRERLVFWRGNVTAVYRELVDAAAAGGPPAPSLRTLQRAVRGAVAGRAGRAAPG